MPDSTVTALSPSLAELLHANGWSPDHPALREAAPVATRGHNLVFAAPPSPAWAAPILAGVLSQALERARPVIGLAPEAGLDEWTRIAARLGRAAGARVRGARTPARASRVLSSGADLLLLTPDTAHQLVRRSALPLAEIPAFLLIWPEQWGTEAAAIELLHDADREAQRIVVTADPAAAAGLIERYCWRAPITDLLQSTDAAAGSLRVVTTAWDRRLEALRDLVEQLDPSALTVWAADLADRDAIVNSTRSTGVDVAVTNQVPGTSGLIVAYDLPGPAEAAGLTAQGEVILLVPPGAEAFVAGLPATRRALGLSRALEQARTGVAAARGAVAEVAERGPAAGAFLAVAPLLERYDAATVAAAIYELWEPGRSAAPPTTPAASAGTGTGTGTGGKIWLGIGKRDGVTPNDLVGAVIKQGGAGKDAVGKVEIRDGFSLVEIRAADAAAIAEKLAGVVLRKKRVVVRLDRGQRSAR